MVSEALAKNLKRFATRETFAEFADASRAGRGAPQPPRPRRARARGANPPRARDASRLSRVGGRFARGGDRATARPDRGPRVAGTGCWRAAKKKSERRETRRKNLRSRATSPSAPRELEGPRRGPRSAHGSGTLERMRPGKTGRVGFEFEPSTASVAATRRATPRGRARRARRVDPRRVVAARATRATPRLVRIARVARETSVIAVKALEKDAVSAEGPFRPERPPRARRARDRRGDATASRAAPTKETPGRSRTRTFFRGVGFDDRRGLRVGSVRGGILNRFRAVGGQRNVGVRARRARGVGDAAKDGRTEKDIADGSRLRTRRGGVGPYLRRGRRRDRGRRGEVLLLDLGYAVLRRVCARRVRFRVSNASGTARDARDEKTRSATQAAERIVAGVFSGTETGSVGAVETQTHHQQRWLGWKRPQDWACAPRGGRARSQRARTRSKQPRRCSGSRLCLEEKPGDKTTSERASYVARSPSKRAERRGYSSSVPVRRL